MRRRKLSKELNKKPFVKSMKPWKENFTDLIDVNNEQTNDTLVEVNESNTVESMPVSQELHDTQSQEL